VHTAVKIAPHYEGPVVYVPDASRSVGVAQNLLGDNAASYIAELKADYDKVRASTPTRSTPLWPLAKARANKTRWTGAYQPAVPFMAAACSRTSTWPSWPYIDWGPFFQTWDLAGPTRPSSTRSWATGAQGVRRRPGHAEDHRGRWLQASGVLGLYPPTAWTTTTSSSTPTTRSQALLTWHGLRQQTERRWSTA
jgi:5-methyltetrahydrofolate--homocysteine methyltransferase